MYDATSSGQSAYSLCALNESRAGCKHFAQGQGKMDNVHVWMTSTWAAQATDEASLLRPRVLHHAEMDILRRTCTTQSMVGKSSPRAAMSVANRTIACGHKPRAIRG